MRYRIFPYGWKQFEKECDRMIEKSQREQLLEMKARWEQKGIHIRSYNHGWAASVDYDDGTFEDIWEKTLTVLDGVLKKKFK